MGRTSLRKPAPAQRLPQAFIDAQTALNCAVVRGDSEAKLGRLRTQRDVVAIREGVKWPARDE